MKRFLLLLLTVVGTSINLTASNFHEHLFSLPTSENILPSASIIFSLPKEEQKLSLIFKTQTDLHRFISSKWGDAKADAFIQEKGLGGTIIDLCYAMDTDPKEALKKLLAFELGCEEKQKLYVDLEEVRKTLILALPVEEVEQIFTRYFEEEPLINRKVISVSVTRRFFEKDQQGKHRRLKQLAEKYGSQLVYRVSLQRQILLSEGIALNKEVFALIDKGEIGGIDVVGSLNEKKHVYKETQEHMQKQLVHLFDFISERSLVLVLHLFEGMNEGPFYEALENVLRTYEHPLYLEIGHIAHMNAHWIEVFSSNPPLKVLFHVNARSNELLQGRTFTETKQTVENLLALGFTVVPGSDGRGILPGATYLEQTGLLGCALHHKSFLSELDERFQEQSPFRIFFKLLFGLTTLPKLPMPGYKIGNTPFLLGSGWQEELNDSISSDRYHR